MGRRKKKQIITNLPIHGIAEKGKAVGRANDGQIIFLNHAVPGDIVDCVVTRKKKGYKQAVVTAVVEYSVDRMTPFCNHFDDCGGCKWQDFSYQKQLEHKEKEVRAAISKLAKINPDGILHPIVPAERTRYYRNKLEYSFSSARWKNKEEIATIDKIEDDRGLGFHPPGFYNKVVDVETCYLQDNRSNIIRNEIRRYSLEKNLTYYNINEHHGLLRNLIVRNTSIEQWMLIVVFGEDQPDEIESMMTFVKDSFPFLNSIYYVINQKMNDSIFDQDVIYYHGEKWIHEFLGEIKYKVSPKSFFQTNSLQAKILYDLVVEYAALKKEDNVYDLYTGLGSIALYIASYCKSVVGVEEIPMAIEDAKFNMELNGITNASFFAGDVKDVLTQEFINTHPKPDVIITDPPRAGMHGDVVNTILTLAPNRIIYVSCNPSTQARDIQKLAERYTLKKICPVDMFPHTHHVESVALLELI